MNSKEWSREMALYTKWQNETLYGHCDRLSDSGRKKDRGMFFGSVHRTLDHILMVDTLLRDFFVMGTPPTQFEPEKEVYSVYEDLARARATFDQDLLALIESNADDWLDDLFTFDSERKGGPVTLPRKFYCMQMFNHGTHHRSQITSELHKMGIDYGNTDMPFNPYSQYWSD